MLQQSMEFLSQYDPEVGASIQEEFARERCHIELIASENIVSEAVMLAQGSCLTNKYAEGYPGKRYYGGCYAVDVTEDLARRRGPSLPHPLRRRGDHHHPQDPAGPPGRHDPLQ